MVYYQMVLLHTYVDDEKGAERLFCHMIHTEEFNQIGGKTNVSNLNETTA
jgi:hypothetical protein